VLVASLFYLILLVAAGIISVFENANNRRYIAKARKVFESRPDLISIGITGSYGKTGVKNILYEMLKKSFNVVKTAASYNTPLGIAIASKDIDTDTQVFIAEMGARHIGDIEELCDIVKPKYGIITGIAEQHLETFKSIDNIINTKLELYCYVAKANGVCVFNTDNDMLAKKAKHLKYRSIITSKSNEGADIYAYDIIADAAGSSFKLKIKEGIFEISTILLGRSNISNIAAAAALASRLGISGDNIAEAVRLLGPVEHRLQLIGSGDIIIIDDTYNSNPLGAAVALDVLKMFPGRKVVVTCGFAEAGNEAVRLNRELGLAIADAADIAILIGRNSSWIKDGLEDKGLTNIKQYPTLKEAKKHFSELFISGDVILMENDMPDNLE